MLIEGVVLEYEDIPGDKNMFQKPDNFDRLPVSTCTTSAVADTLILFRADEDNK